MSLQPRVLFYKNIPFYKDNSSGYYLSENGEYMQDFVWKSFKHLDSIPEGYEVQHKDLFIRKHGLIFGGQSVVFP